MSEQPDRQFLADASHLIRQTAALSFAMTLGWDYFRDPSVVESFSIWALAIHFIYFQLPLKSKALPYFHATSFIGAGLVPVLYASLLLWKPSLEVIHMEQWELSWSTVVMRALLVHIAPLLFHTLDVTLNQVTLINSYKAKPWKLMYLWSFSSFAVVGIINEFTFPETEDFDGLQGIDINDLSKRNKVISLVVLVFSFSVLYLLVLRRAYPLRGKKTN